jgi:MoxR-like ATPase
MMKFGLGYPHLDDELKMLSSQKLGHPIDSLQAVVSSDEIIEAQRMVRTVHVDPKISQYILQIVHLSRKHEHLNLGGSPRASIALFRASQALAAIRGRNFVLPDDVKMIAPPVLSHRIILKPESRLRKIVAESVVAEILSTVAVPVIS